MHHRHTWFSSTALLLALGVSALAACSEADDPSGNGGTAGAAGSSEGSGGAVDGVGGLGGSGGSGGIGDGSCVVGETVYSNGDPVPSGDCNSCSCIDGDVACTAMACVTDTCELPFDAGECDAAIPVFAFDATSGQCVLESYGGCGGNDNRFDTLAACEAACVATGASCEVDGVVYPDGSTGVPDPTSCNTCSCNDGVVDICTEINCPNTCPDGESFGTECAECGPTDACEVVRSGCLVDCTSDDDCSSGMCNEGQCRAVCG